VGGAPGSTALNVYGSGTITGGLNLGSATGALTGWLRASGDIVLIGNNQNVYVGQKDVSDNSNLYFKSETADANFNIIATGTGAAKRGTIYAIYGNGWTSNYIRMYHDGTNGNVYAGTGGVVVSNKLGVGGTPDVDAQLKVTGDVTMTGSIKGSTALAVRAYRNAVYTNTSGTMTVLWDAESFDNASMHSTASNTDRLIAPVAGIYEIKSQICWDSSSGTGSSRGIYIKLGGSTTIAVDYQNGVTQYVCSTAATIYQMAANEYVIVQATQGSGSDVPFFVGAGMMWASMVRLP
jgi:hypothetical protein